MSNRLPANLPENWTQGDIVAPNGSDIGRPENYGYNYLNKQVNDAQTEINSINDILGEVAQQDDLIAVKNAIGAPASTSKSTVFGKLNILKTDLAAVNESIVSSIKRNTSAAYEYVVKKEESGLTGSNQVNVSVNMKGVVKAIPITFVQGTPSVIGFTMVVDGETIYDNVAVSIASNATAVSPLIQRLNGTLLKPQSSSALATGDSVLSVYVENNISISFTLTTTSPTPYGYTLAFLQERQ